MTTPVDVVGEWFAAWERGDLDSARETIAPDAPATANGAVVARRLDEFRDWYVKRRDRLGESFAYRVDDLLGGERAAAALITLSTDRGSWRQVTVYDAADGRITELRAFEEPEPS